MVCCVVEVVYLTAQTVRIDETCKTGLLCTFTLLSILQTWQQHLQFGLGMCCSAHDLSIAVLISI